MWQGDWYELTAVRLCPSGDQQSRSEKVLLTHPFWKGSDTVATNAQSSTRHTRI